MTDGADTQVHLLLRGLPLPLFTRLPLRSQAVEKVVVGLVGGLKTGPNTTNTSMKRGSRPLNGGQTRTGRSFSTR